MWNNCWGRKRPVAGVGDSALGPRDRPSLAEPAGMGGRKEAEGVLTRSSPVPTKGWLLPGPGSGHAEGDFRFSQQSSITLGRGELPSPRPDSKPGCSISSASPRFSQIASGQERTSGSQGPAFLWGCLGLTWGPASGEGAGPSLGGEPGWEGNSPRSCRGLGERRRRGAVGKGRGIWAE